ncbi:DUF6387 family protein [Proteus mirabilis]|uniref:DUF6387 family protein n=1 Tax=Proteus mirabilis TaxID=584 RepID=UPI0034E3897E
MKLPESEEEFEAQMEQIRLNLLKSDAILNELRALSFGVKDLQKILDIHKYDEITKEFHPIQFYVAFKKRLSILDLFYPVEIIRSETYEEYVEQYEVDEDIDGDAPISESVYKYEKIERINFELTDASEFLHKLIYGDAISITSEDIKYGTGWENKIPIKIIDMNYIAFMNRRCGVMGGMNNSKYNKIISQAIEKDSSIENIKSIDSIPRGYGWPTGLFTSEKKIWAEIDLNIPDEILIETFKTWITESRKIYSSIVNIEIDEKIKNNIKASTLKKWISMRILAYLDFKILCLFYDIEPTLKQTGDIIFFDEYDVDTTEKVRKTLIPMANEIMTDEYLDNLIRKVTVELM